MSMLAEPRCRIKWTLNPRGNWWSEDETNYGQRILRKMGWEKGKGLGKNEDGKKEHIKVTYKNDKKGIGAIGHEYDWIAHQDGFNSVLSSLNEQFSSSSLHTVPKDPGSLEIKTKSSRPRGRYHKFIKGKDITTYSSKDMAAILGSKKKENEELKEEESLYEDLKKNDTEETTLITYNSGQNIQEYFKQKMAFLGYSETKITDYQKSVPPGEDNTIVQSKKDILESYPELPVNVSIVKENWENIAAKQQKKHKNRKKEVDAEFGNSGNFSKNRQAKLNEKNKQQCANNGIHTKSLNPSMMSGTYRNCMAKTLSQEMLHSSKVENSVNSVVNCVPKKTEGNIINHFTESNKQDQSELSKRTERKRKLGVTLNQPVSKEVSNTCTFFNDSVSAPNCNTTTDNPNREDPLGNSLTSSNEIPEVTLSKKAKKLKKNKIRKTTENGNISPNLEVYNAKTYVRYNALQQMKVYFGVFPNKNTLHLLKKYEDFYENVSNCGLASSNLLAIPGYGNKFLLKDHTAL